MFVECDVVAVEEVLDAGIEFAAIHILLVGLDCISSLVRSLTVADMVTRTSEKSRSLVKAFRRSLGRTSY